MDISAEAVKKLRAKTGVGLMDCKEALKQSNGDMDKALDYLREKGLAKLQKRMGKAALEGTIASYIHTGGKVGVMVEVNCETDFVAKTDQFQEFAKDIAMQITAANPLYVKREDVPENIIAKEKEIYKKQALESERDLYKGIVTVLSDFSLPAKRDNGVMYYGKQVVPLIFLFVLLVLIILANKKKIQEVINKY